HRSWESDCREATAQRVHSRGRPRSDRVSRGTLERWRRESRGWLALGTRASGEKNWQNEQKINDRQFVIHRAIGKELFHSFFRTQRNFSLSSRFVDVLSSFFA